MVDAVVTVDDTAVDFDRDQYREFAAAVLVSIVAVTLWAILMPTRFEYASFTTDAIDRENQELLLLIGTGLLASFGGMLVGAAAWIMLAEHRRPWPFGPRRRRVRRVTWRSMAAVVVAAAAGSLLARLTPGLVPSVSGRYIVAGRDDVDLVVEAPADFARVWIVSTVILFGLYAAAQMLVRSTAGRQRR